MFFLLAVATAARAQVVTGRVVDVDTNAGVAGAQVELVDTAGATANGVVADSTGRFSLLAVEPGVYTLRVEHIAYAPTTSARFQLGRGEQVKVELRVTQRQIELEPLVVTARRTAGNARLAEFYDRAERNRATGKGVVLTRVELEPLDGESALKVVSRQTLLFTRPNPVRPCLIRTYWNGMLVEESDDQHWRRSVQAGGSSQDGGTALWEIPTSTVEGIEIYDDPEEIPVQYYDYNVCGVILVWSRPVQPGEGKRGSWLVRGLLAGGIFAVLITLMH